MRAFFDICLPCDDDGIRLTQSDAVRLLCHVLIQHLPAAAVSEALNSLAEAYDFYRSAPPPPSLEPQQALKAKVTGNHAAPVFPVEEE